MDREILFRGKRINNGEWVEGDLVHSIYKLNDTCVGKYGCTLGMHQVIPETVGQYTGLKDKNGKKIFEGDILAFNGDKLICIYKNGCFGFMFKGCFVTFKSFCRTNFEVIGNIHDTPDLLEVSE